MNGIGEEKCYKEGKVLWCMRKISESIEEMITKVQDGTIEGVGGKSFDMLELIKSGFSSEKKSFVGYKYTYEVSIPIWQSTMDYFKIVTPKADCSKFLLEKKEDIIRIVEFINDSQENIINALIRDNSEDMKDFRPTKVSSVLFNYSGERPKYSFYVESNDTYSFHVYIKDDMSFDAGYIS